MTPTRILLLTLEYPRWCDAGKFSYESNFGFEEGLAANGVDFLTAPAFFAEGPSPWKRWQECIQRHIGNRRFDQVWFDVVHARFDDPFLEWIRERADIRLGYVGESSAFDPVELATNPHGVAARRDNAARNLGLATHVLAVDESDVDRINRECNIPAFWWAAGQIPSRLIADHPAFTAQGQALFFGTLYGKRKEWIEHPQLRSRIALGNSLEAGSPWPAAYDETTHAVEQALAAGATIEGAMWTRFVDGLRQTRRACYPLWLKSLTAAGAIVNLPQYARAYASRVTQSMAAGVPVLSWEIPDWTIASFETRRRAGSDILKSILRKGDSVFDIGANAGDKAERFVQAGAQVVCFEPQPSCVEKLARRFEAHAAVQICPQGLAAQPGELELSICSEADTLTTFSEAWKQDVSQPSDASAPDLEPSDACSLPPAASWTKCCPKSKPPTSSEPQGLTMDLGSPKAFELHLDFLRQSLWHVSS